MTLVSTTFFPASHVTEATAAGHAQLQVSQPLAFGPGWRSLLPSQVGFAGQAGALSMHLNPVTQPSGPRTSSARWLAVHEGFTSGQLLVDGVALGWSLVPPTQTCLTVHGAKHGGLALVHSGQTVSGWQFWPSWLPCCCCCLRCSSFWRCWSCCCWRCCSNCFCRSWFCCCCCCLCCCCCSCCCFCSCWRCSISLFCWSICVWMLSQLDFISVNWSTMLTRISFSCSSDFCFAAAWHFVPMSSGFAQLISTCSPSGPRGTLSEPSQNSFILAHGSSLGVHWLESNKLSALASASTPWAKLVREASSTHTFSTVSPFAPKYSSGEEPYFPVHASFWKRRSTPPNWYCATSPASTP